MGLDLHHLPADVGHFLADRHLATLSTIRADGSPHTVPVGFTWDAATHRALVITNRTSVKARHAATGGRAAVCQVDGRRWVTLEGALTLRTDPEAVAEAERRYAVRYRQPRPNPDRVVLEITVDRVLGWPGFGPSDDQTGAVQTVATTSSSTTRSRNASTAASR